MRTRTAQKRLGIEALPRVSRELASSETGKPPRCPAVDGGREETWCMYPVEQHSAIRNEETLPVATACVILLREVRRKKEPRDFTHMQCVKEQMNQQKKKKMQRHRQQNGDYQKEGGGGGGRGYMGPNIWWQKKTKLWVGNTQCNIQMMAYGMVHLTLR